MPRGAIQRGGRLVGEQHRRIGQQRPGHAHPLRLATGEAVRLLIEQAGTQPDVFEHVSSTLDVDVGQCDAQVVEHGAGEERRSLEHHRHLPAQLGRRPVGERPTPPPHLAGERVVEAVQETKQRRLAGARRTGQHRHPVRRHHQVDRTQNRIALDGAGIDTDQLECISG